MSPSELPKNLESDRVDTPVVPVGEPSLVELEALYKVTGPEKPEVAIQSFTTDSIGLPMAVLNGSDLNNTELTLGLSSEEQELIKDQFTRLKTIFESTVVSEEAKDFFFDADVSAVIAGIKPMSYVQPTLEDKKWGFIKKNVGLSKADLVAIQQISDQLGILTLRNERLEKMRNKRIPEMKHVALMLVINLQKTLDAMQTSGAFTAEEIAEFTESPIDAQLKRWNDGNPDYVSNYRTGYQLGYPTSDVKDFIRLGELQRKSPETLTDEELNFLQKATTQKQGVSVKGMRGNTGWVTLNPESEDTQQLQTRLDQSFAIQKSVFES
jgi:hypothetical protein